MIAKDYCVILPNLKLTLLRGEKSKKSPFPC